ncbi:alkylated DNA repair protein [Idiomarina sp. A28L]|uniref:alpha-ketoglutarate-dependent dioxygenase AlkB family protein n=1 Tax=Idiomarina sp. A28L TaxID=1036674 RepID=UPI0002138E81|nr:alpha-ketoglutarate-dependent dioxygenase AlkB [Idiomarina sp. A28L]EGN76270.1 alkylated DNA repair protein [Idiomarina sp. A28L]
MKIPLNDAEVEYISEFFSKNEADRIQSALLEELSWHQGDVYVFGRWHKTPRLQAWHGEKELVYRYSGKSLTAEPWSPTLNEIRNRLMEYGFKPNAVLANQYRNGSDKMGWHSDDEPELGVNPIILSLSFGAQRDFDFRHKKTKETYRIPLEHGSLLIMKGSTQRFWQHQLPARKRENATRINLTFRSIFS